MTNNKVTPFVGVWIETFVQVQSLVLITSHPSWVCGLKLKYICWKMGIKLSHPSWVCGLKPARLFGLPLPWRHTLRGCVDWNRQRWSARGHRHKSHPSWVCGLKLLERLRTQHAPCHTLRGCVDWNLKGLDIGDNNGVTPFVGVWIETSDSFALTDSRTMSHPSWVCGLKQWIQRRWYQSAASHTLRGCVDWNSTFLWCTLFIGVTPFVGVWIETLKHRKKKYIDFSHTLRGCVDWNNGSRPPKTNPSVTPFVGVWIETLSNKKY